MKFFFLLIFCIVAWKVSAQKTSDYKNSVKITSGRVLFGTGDVAGFSINIEGSRDLISKSKKFVSRLLIGTEFSFENGTKNPVIKNPSDEEFISHSFRHTSNSVLSGKLTYYPFRSVFRGFNISIGPSIGFQYVSAERNAQRVMIFPGEYRRKSELYFENKILAGYRITTGYEFAISKKILAGFRLDFANYDNGDINTLAAGKIGVRF